MQTVNNTILESENVLPFPDHLTNLFTKIGANARNLTQLAEHASDIGNDFCDKIKNAAFANLHMTNHCHLFYNSLTTIGGNIWLKNAIYRLV